MLQQLFQMFSDAVLSQLDNYDVKDKPEFKPASRVRRDSEGRSARERSFEWFDEGCRPSQLPDLGVKPRTLYRYFQSWKHLERDLDLRLRTRLLRHVPGIEAIIAREMKVPEEEVRTALRSRNFPAAIRRAIVHELEAELDALEAGELTDSGRAWALLVHCPPPHDERLRERLLEVI